jgi:hypothetical protein
MPATMGQDDRAPNGLPFGGFIRNRCRQTERRSCQDSAAAANDEMAGPKAADALAEGNAHRTRGGAGRRRHASLGMASRPSAAHRGLRSLLRKARGLAPAPVFSRDDGSGLDALGASAQRSSFAAIRGLASALLRLELVSPPSPITASKTGRNFQIDGLKAASGAI